MTPNYSAVLSVLLVVIAVFLAVSRPSGQVLARRLAAADTAPAARRRLPWRALALSAFCCVALIGAGLTAGPRGVVVLLAALVALGVGARVFVSRQRAAAAMITKIEVAHACSVLASQVAVGRVPSEALNAAVEDCPVLADADAAQRIGAEVVPIWRQRAVQRGHSGLGDLARAWQVSTVTGAPMARSLEQVAKALAADQTLGQLIEGELAAPRATGRLMAVLPFVGLGLGFLIGGDPLAFLLDQPIGWACLLLGTVLAGVGVLWIERLADQASIW